MIKVFQHIRGLIFWATSRTSSRKYIKYILRLSKRYQGPRTLGTTLSLRDLKRTLEPKYQVWQNKTLRRDTEIKSRYWDSTKVWHRHNLFFSNEDASSRHNSYFFRVAIFLYSCYFFGTTTFSGLSLLFRSYFFQNSSLLEQNFYQATDYWKWIIL